LTTPQKQEEKNGEKSALDDLVEFVETLTVSLDRVEVILPTLPLGLLA